MVNKWIGIGRLGADPEVRFTGKGTPVSNFKLATDNFWKDSDQKKHKKTDWHKCTCWGRLAEVAGEHLKTGDMVYVEGRLSYDSYEDSSGNTIYYSYIHVETMKFVNVKGNKKKEDVEFPKGGGDDVPF